VVGLPRLEGQRAAGIVGTEGVGHEPCEKLAHRGWSGLGRHDRRLNRDGERGPPERPDDDRVRQGHLAMGGPPCQDTRADRPEGVDHRVAEAKGFTTSGVVSGSVDGHHRVYPHLFSTDWDM
jgi:hypothetical protein